MVTVGLIGAGFMGRTHAQAYGRLANARVKTVADVQMDRAEAVARELEARSAASEEIVLGDPEIDLVDIALPTPAHAPAAIRAFEAGKHVVVEKPMALSLKEAGAMLEAARRANRFLMVAHVTRFFPVNIAIHDIVTSNRLGRPLMATAYRLTNVPQWSSWFQDPNMTGGAVVDLHIHDVDLFNWFFGKPKSVVASGVKDERGGWNAVMSMIEYPGVAASAEASFMMPRDYPFTAGLRILCARGAIEHHLRAGGASFEQGKPELHSYVHEDGKPCQSISYEPGDGFENEIEYFAGCVDRGVAPERVTAQDAYLALQVALASRQSLVSGERVPIP